MFASSGAAGPVALLGPGIGSGAVAVVGKETAGLAAVLTGALTAAAETGEGCGAASMTEGTDGLDVAAASTGATPGGNVSADFLSGAVFSG